jgi:hypothetical protein
VHLWYQQHQRQNCHWYQRHQQQILPPVSLVLLIPVANFKFATSVNNNPGKFAAGVNNTGGNLPMVSTTPVANVLPVSMTPVANNGKNIRLVRP